MNAPLALLAITAVAGLFVMALVGFNSEITGQPTLKVSKETLQKVAEGGQKNKASLQLKQTQSATALTCMQATS